MKKKILVCLIFLITCFFNVNSVLAFDAGSCIEGFGTIKKGSGSTSNTATLSKVEISGTTDYNWDDKTTPRKFNVTITSKSNYKIQEIIYRVSSKDGYSCNGVIDVSSSGYSSIELEVEINKKNIWVDDVSFYARTTKTKNAEVTTDFTPKKTVKVKYNNVTTTKYTGEESITCKFLEDVFGEYWNWILILAPVATMILITIDFVGCILSSDAEAMKKVGDKTIKRTIALVLLLMLPIVLKLIFNLFGLDICG